MTSLRNAGRNIDVDVEIDEDEVTIDAGGQVRTGGFAGGLQVSTSRSRDGSSSSIGVKGTANAGLAGIEAEFEKETEQRPDGTTIETTRSSVGAGVGTNGANGVGFKVGKEEIKTTMGGVTTVQETATLSVTAAGETIVKVDAQADSEPNMRPEWDGWERGRDLVADDDGTIASAQDAETGGITRQAPVAGTRPPDQIGPPVPAPQTPVTATGGDGAPRGNTPLGGRGGAENPSESRANERPNQQSRDQTQDQARDQPGQEKGA